MPLFSEEWLGQKGLLAVGVIFLVLAAGHLLKLSFDREWISPAVRCVGGALVGAGVAGLGWRLHHKGTRIYGAALIGAGASIIYIAVWAAAKLYEFLPPQPAVIALALVAVGLAAVAYVLDLEALGAAAALGGFFAPLVIGHEAGNANLLLLYLGTLGVGLGAVSAIKRWRIAMGLVALTYFGMAALSEMRDADPLVIYAYGIIGGAGGLFVGLREGWFETRLLAFGGGWAVLGIADDQSDDHWLTLLGGMLLTVPVWWRALTRAIVWPDHAEKAYGSIGDTFYFYLSPLLLGAALRQVAPGTFGDHQGLVPAIIALPYLAAGFSAVRRPFAIVGVISLALAIAWQWEPLLAAQLLLPLSLGWAFLDQTLQREDGAWYSAATYLFGLSLLVAALDARSGGGAAFVDGWALTLWAAVAVAIMLASRLLRRPVLVPIFWVLAGLELLFGVTAELWRHFSAQRGSDLAGGLAVSAWWILYAAGCFFAGFKRQFKPLRLTGFLVAGCALAKVLLIDLSTLDAFYRIGSALILGVVCLAIAYVYHRGRAAPAAS